MILVNRNFGNYALSQAIGDMFKGNTDDLDIGSCNHLNVLATNSNLVAKMTFGNPTTNWAIQTWVDGYQSKWRTYMDNYKPSPKNLFIVTEKFLKTLDKVYTKIWNESFTEIGIYTPSNLATIYNGLVTDTSLDGNSLTSLIYDGGSNPATKEEINIMLFKKFVDRCITAGILDEADRLDYRDQIILSNLNRADLSTQIDLDNKLITFTALKPIDIKPDLNALNQEYLNGKKLYLMMTPYLTNESVIKNITSESAVITEPFLNTLGGYSTTTTLTDKLFPVRQPLAFFKPKTDASKFGRSLPLATHLLWSLGTPADKEIALIEGTPVPDLVFDHLDRISHIDSLVLKIKFDKLQF